MVQSSFKAEPGKQEVIMTSLFDSPRELVFKIYTDPKLIPLWWGPRNLTTVINRMEVRPGGLWRFVQRDPGGNIFAFHGVYHDIVPSERIVETFEFEGTPGHVLLETAVFEDHAGGTRLTISSVYQSIGGRDEMMNSGMEAGSIESMERLDVLLEKKKKAL